MSTERQIFLTEPPWHNGCVCWVETLRADGTRVRCEHNIGEKAKKLRDPDGNLQGGRDFNVMRRTCWLHQRFEAEAQTIPLR